MNSSDIVTDSNPMKPTLIMNKDKLKMMQGILNDINISSPKLEYYSNSLKSTPSIKDYLNGMPRMKDDDDEIQDISDKMLDQNNKVLPDSKEEIINHGHFDTCFSFDEKTCQSEDEFQFEESIDLNERVLKTKTYFPFQSNLHPFYEKYKDENGTDKSEVNISDKSELNNLQIENVIESHITNEHLVSTDRKDADKQCEIKHETDDVYLDDVTTKNGSHSVSLNVGDRQSSASTHIGREDVGHEFNVNEEGGEAVKDIISDFEYQSINESQEETIIPEMEKMDVILNENTKSVTADENIKIRNLIDIPKHKSFYNEVMNKLGLSCAKLRVRWE